MKRIIISTLVLVLLVLTACKQQQETLWTPAILENFKSDQNASVLPDFSYAGYQYGEQEISVAHLEVFELDTFGAIPNDEVDDTDAINKAIEVIGENGGGILKFSAGKYLINTDTTQTNIIQINYSNIVLDGAGSGEAGTVIYSGSATDQAEDNSPWLSPFVIHSGIKLQGTSEFFGAHKLQHQIEVVAAASKGDTRLKVTSTEGIQPKDFIYVSMQNTSKEGNLMNALMGPLEFETFQKTYTEAGLNEARSYQYLFEVKAVPSKTEIELMQPLRRDLELEYAPSIAAVEMLRNIGVQNFRFESAWDGAYKHHGNREMDYGWGAVNLQRVAHGFVRNLVIENYNQTTHVVNSRNVSVDNIVIDGKVEGHYGPKTYHSCDNLFTNIQVNFPVTHGPSVEGASFGNVFKNIHYKHPTPIDLHGSAGKDFAPPMQNLFEDISNVSRVAGGAAPQNTPHAGEYNTFWNLNFEGWEDENYKELFYSWIWRDTERFSKTMHIDCHKQYLRSIVVGANSSRSEAQLTIEHNAADRSDEWIYVEGMNNGKKAVSLYETQLNLRLKK